MRDLKRLDDFYAKLCELHKKYVPDWRFTQLMTNYVDALGRDPFYDEESYTIMVMEAWLKHICNMEE